jgi:thiamine monophosphate synthase
MKADNVVKQAVEAKPKTEQELAQAFVKEYEELCQKHQFQIIVTPAWRISQDTGDWRLVLQSSVGRLPKQQ